jgi:hypothetical protein
MTNTLEMPFSAGQLELLKLFKTPLSDTELRELKDVLLAFKFRKLEQVIEKDVQEKGYKVSDFDKMQNEHNRTPYRSNQKLVRPNKA